MNAIAVKDEDEQIERIRALMESPQASETVRTLLNVIDEKAAAAVRRGNDAATAATAPVATAVTATAPRRRRKGATMTGTPLPVATQVATNVPPLQKLLDECTVLGSKAGEGSDAMIKFDLKVCEAGYLGTLSLEENKHGAGIDDAVKAAEAYVAGRNKAAIFDPKANKTAKTIATTRLMIKLGTTPKWGQGQPMGIVNQLVNLHQLLRKQGTHKLIDVHNALMTFARAQLKRDSLMDDDELREFCVRKTGEPRTGVEVLEAMRKTASKLTVGKVTNCPDALPEAKQIVQVIGRLLTAIAKAQAPGGAQATDQSAAA